MKVGYIWLPVDACRHFGFVQLEFSSRHSPSLPRPPYYVMLFMRNGITGFTGLAAEIVNQRDRHVSNFELPLPDFFHLLPPSILRRLQNGIAHILRLQRIAESRLAWLAFAGGDEEVGDLVREGFRVADLQAGHPPVFHIRLVGVGDMHAAPAAHDAFVTVIEILEPVQVVEIPGDGGVLAVDFEGVERLVAAGVAGGLERGERAVLEAAEEGARVVDLDLLLLPGRGVSDTNSTRLRLRTFSIVLPNTALFINLKKSFSKSVREAVRSAVLNSM